MVPVRRHEGNWHAHLAGGGLVLAPLLVLAALFVFFENEIAPLFQKCVSQVAAGYGNTRADQEAPVILYFIRAQAICSLSLVDWHNGFFALLGTLAVALFTLALWRSTKKLWQAADAQRAADDLTRAVETVRLEGSMAVTKRLADASENAAKAAIAARNRPWIMLDEVYTNAGKWIIGEEELMAQFRLRNYGNAPAFITSIRGILFQSLDEATKEALTGVSMPNDYKDFPLPNDLQNFSRDYVRGAWTNDALTRGPEDYARELCRVVDIGTPLVIPIGEASLRFIFRQWPPRPSVGINDLHPRMYLMGLIQYHGPDGEPWADSFCYVRGREGLLRQIYRAPYNEKKIDTDPIW